MPELGSQGGFLEEIASFSPGLRPEREVDDREDPGLGGTAGLVCTAQRLLWVSTPY